MLYDPKWNQPQPSVAGFKAWLEQQPREKTFKYYSHDCAVGQYIRFIDLRSWPDWRATIQRLNDFAFVAAHKGRVGLPTFGAVLDEINKAGAA